MSIIPEQHEDIPLYDGLKPREADYIINGDHWRGIYKFYISELPKYGWKAEYQQSSQDWGFMSRWRKPEFDGELSISSHYDKFNNQTEVIFDKTRILTSTTWIKYVPESICFHKSPNQEKCLEITDEKRINKIAKMINDAFDTDKLVPRKEYTIINYGSLIIKVHYEKDEMIYLESVKGIKFMKPDPEFLRLINL